MSTELIDKVVSGLSTEDSDRFVIRVSELIESGEDEEAAKNKAYRELFGGTVKDNTGHKRVTYGLKSERF